MRKFVVLVTGASSGSGASAAKALAMAGHTACASMRGTTEKNAKVVTDYTDWAKANKADLRTIELDVQSDESTRAAVK